MANYHATVKPYRQQASIDRLEAGSAGPKLKIGTSNMAVVLAVFQFPTDSTVLGTTNTTNDSIIFDADPDIATTGLANGTPVEAVLTDSDDNEVIVDMTVGGPGSGAEVELSVDNVVLNGDLTLLDLKVVD